MKRVSSCVFMALFLLAVPALSQIDPDPDGVGIYADIDGLVNSVSLEVGEPLEVYLLLTRPSAEEPGLKGWQCGIEVPDNVSIWGWSIPGTFMNAGSPPSFAVGRGSDPTPLDSDVILLMTFILVPLNNSEAVFSINDGGWITPYPGLPLYATDPGSIFQYAMHPYPDGAGEKSFVVNGSVPNDPHTWGEVKALYNE